jgi:hypothetical protein
MQKKRTENQGEESQTRVSCFLGHDVSTLSPNESGEQIAASSRSTFMGNIRKPATVS